MIKNDYFNRYDLVDITRQVIQLLFDEIYEKVINSYNTSNSLDIDIYSQQLLGILDDLELLLASDEHFLLGKWIESAKSLANSDNVILLL